MVKNKEQQVILFHCLVKVLYFSCSTHISRAFLTHICCGRRNCTARLSRSMIALAWHLAASCPSPPLNCTLRPLEWPEKLSSYRKECRLYWWTTGSRWHLCAKAWAWLFLNRKWLKEGRERSVQVIQFDWLVACMWCVWLILQYLFSVAEVWVGSDLRCVGIDVEWRAVMRRPGKSTGGAGEGSILQVRAYIFMCRFFCWIFILCYLYVRL